MSFCLRPNVCKKCGKPLTIFEGWICLKCEKAEQKPCEDAISRVEALKIATTEYELKKIRELPSVNPQPCDDAISRDDRLLDLANAIESDDSGYWTNKRISSALRNISSISERRRK